RPADRGHDAVLGRGGADRSSHRCRLRRVDRAHCGRPGLAFDPPLAPGPGPGPGAVAGGPPDPRSRHFGTAKGNMTMRTAYQVLAYLLALSVAVQASLIAFGAFALENNIDKGPVTDGDTTGVTLHHSFAYVVLACAVALLAVSFLAKVKRGVLWAAIPL